MNFFDRVHKALGLGLPVILAVYSLGTLFVGQVSFKQSTMVSGFWRFVAWQALGHFVAFTGVLAYTWLIKLTSLHLAYAVHSALGFVIVQVIGAWLIFKERITPGQWIGAALVVVGILVIALTRPVPNN